MSKEENARRTKRAESKRVEKCRRGRERKMRGVEREGKSEGEEGGGGGGGR